MKSKFIISLCIIGLCAGLCTCIDLDSVDPLDTDNPTQTFNDVEAYYRQVFPEKRKTRHPGFMKNDTGKYIMDDLDGDGIINAEDPYPLDAFLPGNLIQSINIPLISSTSSDKAHFEIYSITGNKTLTIGTIDCDINEYLNNFNKFFTGKLLYDESGSTYGSGLENIRVSLARDKALKIYIASLNNTYSSKSIVKDIIDPDTGFDRNYVQGKNCPNIPNESIVSPGRIIELIAKKNNPDFSLQQLVNELYYFLTGEGAASSDDILEYFKKGKDRAASRCHKP